MMSPTGINDRGVPPHQRFWCGGVLLVEATISAVVIAVGLAMISRGLSSQLTALRRIEEAETLLSLARATLLELEGERSAGRVPSGAREGTFQEPTSMYRWTIAVRPQEAAEGAMWSEVTVSVQRHDRPSARVQLFAVWPTEWVPEEWL